MHESGHAGTSDCAPRKKGRRPVAAVLPGKKRRLLGKKGRHPAAAIKAEVEGGQEQGEAEAEAGRAEEERAVVKQKA